MPRATTTRSRAGVPLFLTGLAIAVFVLSVATAAFAAARHSGTRPSHHHHVKKASSNKKVHGKHKATKKKTPTKVRGDGSTAGTTVNSTRSTASSTTSTGSSTASTGSSTTPIGNSGQVAPNAAGDTKRLCVYPSEHISLLQVFDQTIGTNVNCVMVFNDASTSWASWSDPWFLHTDPDMSWGSWATEPGTNRQLIITQNLFPSSEDNANWLQAGADGAYEGYAKTLATNLVNAGLGNSIIRLAHEANGDWYPDSIPNTPAGDALWVQFWRNTAIAMRSVPGAHFEFDWTVNAGYRNIPLANFYPGDDVVDIIGVDVYDGSTNLTTGRWNRFYTESMGVQTVQQFAALHGKPMSFPEWGLMPNTNPAWNGGGDDPAYVQGLANFISTNKFAYQSYFFSSDELAQFLHSPQSIAAYKEAFGAGGYAVGPTSHQSSTSSPPVSSPSLQLTGGPAYGSTLPTDGATFTFQAQGGNQLACSLDGQLWRACTGASSDTLTNLAPGYHRWMVQATDANGAVGLVVTNFVAP